MRILLLLAILLSISSCHQPQPNNQVQLQSEWQFKMESDSVWHAAEVPGVVHTDLLANNLIEDPYYGNNEKDLQWIENENWVYQTEFKLSSEELSYNNVSIEFEGLDTYATVYLNGQMIIEADNMFRSWETQIKEHLQSGKNSLKVVFESPIEHNKEFVEKHPYKLPSGNETVDIQVSNFTRKAAYHFGWDWGPRFVTAGIWRPVNLHFWNDLNIEDVFLKTDGLGDNLAQLSGELEVLSSSNNSVDVQIRLKDSVQVVYDTIHRVELKDGLNSIPYKFQVENPKLWWPNGSGEQPLYDFEVNILNQEEIIASESKRVGIKTVELINEPDLIGTSYYFKINGNPIFMKGANYIPQDLFLPRVSEEKYQALFDKITGANMNMIRVWGGGIYENDIFYDLCDEKGILVWQDFMFAGSMYPNLPELKENIEAEVEENIKRLRNHVSIASWCGNNEIEVAWGNWGWQKTFGYSAQDSTEIFDTYKSIFKEMIPQKVQQLTNHIPYISTSPTSNWGRAENFNHGSMHYWGVWHGREPFENYKTNVGRFMVEYGFQSFPSMETISKFSTEKDYSLESEIMLNRQKSYIGNGMISTHVNRWFEEPNSFEDFVEKSQSAQQIGMQMAVQSHRLKAPHCMGTLFWQLNDCWPGPSWSVIDYYGNEKEAFNSISENFKDVIAVYDRDSKKVTILNDSTEDFVGSLKIIDGETESTLNAYVISNSRHEIPVEGTIKNSFITLELIQDSEAIFRDKVYLGNGPLMSYARYFHSN